MSDVYGPCAPWPVLWPCELGADSPAATGIAVTAATEALFALSGRQFGLCETTLRVCRRDCAGVLWPDAGIWPGETYPTPALIAGGWVNLVCGGCPGTCACTTISEVLLPAPVHHIVEVKLDGSPMPTGSYRLDDARRLVRTDGNFWPWCQRLDLDDDQPNTWSVRAAYGREPPELATLAVGELACQFLRGMRGEDCLLPSNWTSLARQGVSLTRPSPADLRADGTLGLYWCDLFLRAYNPAGLKRRAGVYSPDQRPPRRVGTG